jgi:hypothetical protein
VSRLPRQCGILNISQTYRPPRPVTGIALLYAYRVVFLRLKAALRDVNIRYAIRVHIYPSYVGHEGRFCGLVVRVLGYRSGAPGSTPGPTRFAGGGGGKENSCGLERGPLSLVSTIEELLDRKVAAPVYKTENTAVGIRHADHVAPSIRKSWQSLRRQAAVSRSV